MCVNYETIDHVLWGYERFYAKKQQLWMDLRSTDSEWGISIKDILGGRDWRGLRGAALSLGTST
jgi:hypothetical protein